MTRTLLHIAVFVFVFGGTLWFVKDDVQKKTGGMREMPRAVRQWAPDDTAFTLTLMREADSAAVWKLFSDSRFGISDRVAARFVYIRAARKRASYNWLFTDSSLARGKAFLATHRVFLDTIAHMFHVPPEVVTAVLRTESDFGAFPGDDTVVNALYTIARFSSSEERRREALRELACAIRITHEERLDPFTLRGSWAGAFGLSQFRPCSYLTYRRDGDGDGVIDLFTLSDAAASAAYYLQVHGWSKHRHDQYAALRAYNRGRYADAVLSYAARISTR